MSDRHTVRDWLVPIAVITILGAVISLPMLGSSGLSGSEGHRVIPGWTMVELGAADRMEMFGVPFLTKPPGMAYLVGASSLVLGESEFSARFGSALLFTLGGVLAFVCGRLWVSMSCGVAAGIAHLLMPLLWAPARSAEIETLNQFGTQVAVYALLAIVMFDERRIGTKIVWSIGLLLGTFILLLAKGPASVPVLVGTFVAVAMARRSIRPLLRAGPWLGLVLGVALFALVYRPLWRTRTEDAAVIETLGKFIWSDLDIPSILTLAFVAFAASLPASLALLIPWGPDHKRERGAMSADQQRTRDLARTCALGWVVSILIFMTAGVTNARYAMPACVLLPLLAGVIVHEYRAGLFAEHRAKILWWMPFGNWRPWVIGLLITAAFYIHMSEQSRGRKSGRAAGIAMGEMLEPGDVVWMDSIISARPEVAWYASRTSGADVYWAWRELAKRQLPPEGSYVVLREDDRSTERERFDDLIGIGGPLVPIERWNAHEYTFTLYSVGFTQ